MAKSKSKSSGGLAVRRVTSTKERNQGGFFMRLKTDEWLKGYALFTPDPEAANNPGYFEYFEHYDKSNNSYVPCAGDDCYMCELGDNPSVRALTLWYFPDNANGEKLKVLKLNGYMIRDFAEIEAEEGGVLGKKFRVKRLSDKGEYRISPQTDKKLPTKEIKALLKSAMEKTANDNKKSTTPIDFEAITLRQLKAALEKVDAAASLEDTDDDDDEDDDDYDEPKGKSRKGKKEKEEENDEDDDDDDEDEDDDDEDEDDEDENDDDEDESDDDDDSDEDDAEDEDDDDDDDDDEEESTEITGVKFDVVSTSEKDETITVKMDGKNRKLWLAEGVDADWDVVKKGVEITIDADTDDEGDYVITKLKVKKAKADTKKDTGKGKGKGKGKGGKKK